MKLTLLHLRSSLSLHTKQTKHTKTMKLTLLPLVALLATSVSAGPAAYGACQAGCAAIVMACYAAGGATWGKSNIYHRPPRRARETDSAVGATLAITAPATILGCNAAYGTCQTACAAVLLAPTP